jgi:hypothetical protein
VDPAWANRRLLLRAADTLSQRAWDRLEQVMTRPGNSSGPGPSRNTSACS